MAERLAYLGPPGTFSEEAALRHNRHANLIPFPSNSAVAMAVASGMADEGVLPIENSLEGSVPETLDLLIQETRLFIRHELVINVEHYLLVKPGTEAVVVKVVYSHPQALGQCRRFLERCFPKAQAMAALSTAAAVEEMRNSAQPTAAIGTKRAAELYGVEILAQGIQDSPYNVTRFVVLSPSDHAPTGRDKTSIAFSFAEDKPGVLWNALGEFALRDINLAKVESRPAKEELGKYFFLVDVEGHQEDPAVKEALEGVRQKSNVLKIFGSYPKFSEDK